MNVKEHREWRALVAGHSGLTVAERHVLQTLELFADYPGGTNAHPGTEALAKLCRLKTRVVESALQKGRRLNLIEQTARANPKLSLAAVYRLVSPPISTRTVVRIESDFNPHGGADRKRFQPARNAVSTRTPVRPTRSLTPDQKNTRECEPWRDPVAITACTLCDDHGWLLGNDGGATNFRCRHERPGEVIA